MVTGVVNKIIITVEAIFDYEESLGLGRLDKRLMKAEVEEYIDILNRSGRFLHEHYFRCKYYDEGSDQMLILFIYRADKISVMQNWWLVGICVAEDWDEDAEHEGLIRMWLKTRINDLPNENDWAILHRVNQILKETDKTLIESVLKEVVNEFEFKRDKETAESMALLHSIYFDSRERMRIRKKSGRNKWLCSPSKYW